MRILLFSTHSLPESGGVQEAVGRLNRYLTTHGHEVSLVTGLPPYTHRCRTERSPDVTRHRVNLSMPRAATRLRSKLLFPMRFASTVLYLCWQILRRRPDVINLHFLDGATAYALVLAAIGRIPLIVSLHGSDVLIHPKRFRGNYRLLSCAMQRAAAVTVNSDALRRCLRDEYGFDTSKVTIVPNGLEPAVFASVAGHRAYQPYVLVIARLTRVKGVDIVLHAFGEVRRVFPHHRLVIVGDGPEMGALQILTQRLALAGAVVFLGALPNQAIYPLLAGSELFVLASRSEAFSITLLEAMATGTAIVATAVGGVPEVVVDGECATLVAPEAPAQLATAIIRLLADEETRRRFGACGRRRVGAYFTMEQVGARFVHLYQAAVERQRRGA